MVGFHRGEHRRTVLTLLGRLGWRHDEWVAGCRDVRGRPARVEVRLAESGVTLVPSCAGPLTFEPLRAGRLRAAIRDGLLMHDRLGIGDADGGESRAKAG